MQTETNLDHLTSPAAGTGLSNQTVVIADHVYATRKYLEAQLRSWHIRCLPAGSETNLMDTLEQIAVDVLLLNLSLPSRRGKSPVRQIRGLPIWRDLTIIGITELTDPVLLEQIRGSGVDDFISPTVEPEILKNKLTEHIAAKQKKRRAAIENSLRAEHSVEEHRLDFNTGTERCKADDRTNTEPKAPKDYFVPPDPDLVEFFSTRPLLDEDRLGNSRLLYKEHFQELLGSMMETMKQRYQELQTGVRNNDIDGISRTLHSLLGVSGYAGANALRQYIKLRLYTNTCDGQLPGEETWLETVHGLILRSIEELERYWVEKPCETQ